jgi:aspartyl-tRNA(Asn)/glutamyl-tRNA(Gln) amidotransferase subunit A
MSDEDPALTPATLLRERYAAGEVSPVDVVEAVLARAGRLEPDLRALFATDPGRARDEAARSAERWAAGTPAGPADGVPVTLKDNIATAGTPTPVGSAATPLHPAVADAPSAARLRESGAVLVGKTTMPDLGMLTSGLSSYHDLTRNPWDLARTPGGSSAGAATAAAAGYGPIHIGTDIGGSVRLPAGWCGLVGLKPSFGRVPVAPAFLGRVAGPLTRTVADTALAMSVIARPDDRDHLSLPPSDVDWDVTAPDSLAGKRVGLLLDAGVGLPVDPEITDAVTRAAAVFEAHGAVVEPVPAFLTRTMLDGLDAFWRARAWSDLLALGPERRAAALPYIVAWAERAARLDAVEAYRGFAQIDAISIATLRATAPFDAVLSPTCPVGPPPAGAPSPTGDPERPLEHIAFTLPANMSGQPAVSLNCGYHRDGLPIGLQIQGRRFADDDVLALAAFYERHRPAQRAWPLDQH